ncbi:hypothetical protein ECG_00505 [Echinococcus granulosus]|uniref:Expressed protein n=1 Tax=Echinococcus granulosus TaxID=6210 RepID=A0A068WG65_ECHGR|nr:hypothetical protein ECG_00505 [Echinococcus granulosus]CDS16649.1 expressed protein [Echinococcus granulosus]
MSTSDSLNESITSCEEALRFVNDYAYLCGQSLEDMKSFHPTKCNPACDRLRADLAQLLEEKKLVEAELNTLQANRERAIALLEILSLSFFVIKSSLTILNVDV